MMDQREKTKRYELGSFVASKRPAKVDHKCNCCTNVIHAGIEYIEISKQNRHVSTRVAVNTVYLHYECFRAAMRMLRNAMEVLIVPNSHAATKGDG